MASAGQLMALSPLDGRYGSQVSGIATHFSEFGLIRNRVRVEVEYFIFLSQHHLGTELSDAHIQSLRQTVEQFDLKAAQKIKDFEAETRHDVKAVEYYLRQVLHEHKLPGSEWLHFALTSEDVNSMALGLCLKESLEEVILPTLRQLIDRLVELTKTHREIIMLGRTHGQAAVPTTLGKELLVFAIRLAKIYRELKHLPVEAKLTGAVGNFNAHVAAFPKTDWLKLSHTFVSTLGLTPNLYTTQILPAESYSFIFQQLQNANSVILDLNQDVWRYISDGYLIQETDKHQVGSSTMPHKVNPIDFENSEGNVGLANALLIHFTQKLPISRLQRDLSDSTVKRNIGVSLGYCQLAYLSCLRGLTKIKPDAAKMKHEVVQHWEIVSEGLQTILRAAGEETAYEQLKEVTRGQAVTAESIKSFITGLSVTSEVKQALAKLEPATYVGSVSTIIDHGLHELGTILDKE